jgi:hypothetical protein
MPDWAMRRIISIVGEVDANGLDTKDRPCRTLDT